MLILQFLIPNLLKVPIILEIMLTKWLSQTYNKIMQNTNN